MTDALSVRFHSRTFHRLNTLMYMYIQYNNFILLYYSNLYFTTRRINFRSVNNLKSGGRTQQHLSGFPHSHNKGHRLE